MSLTNENEAGIQLLKHHFPEMTDQQLQQFGRLGELYGEWNEKINVISKENVTSIDNVSQASEHLHAMTENLNNELGKFKS